MGQNGIPLFFFMINKKVFFGGRNVPFRYGTNVPPVHFYRFGTVEMCRLLIYTSAIICSCLLLPLAVPVFLCQHLYLSTSAVVCTVQDLSTSAFICTWLPLLSSVSVYLCCRLYPSSSALVCFCLLYLWCRLYLSTSAVVCTCLALLSSVPV